MFYSGDKQPTDARPEALALAYALEELIDARENLSRAINAAPSYTGQYSRADYVGEEQEAFNRAADAYADAVRVVCGFPALRLLDVTEEERIQTELSQPVRNLNIPARVWNTLVNEGYIFLGDFYETSPPDSLLLRIPNFGRRSLNELKEYLAARHLPVIGVPGSDERIKAMLAVWVRPKN